MCVCVCVCIRTCCAQFYGILFCIVYTENSYKRRRDIWWCVYTYGERTIILYTHINPLNNSIREHPMIYVHRPRIPDSSRTRIKSVIDNVNARRLIRRNLPFLSNMLLPKLTRLYYSLLILIIYALCYVFSCLIQLRPIFFLLVHAKFSDLVCISHQKYMYI